MKKISLIVSLVVFVVFSFCPAGAEIAPYYNSGSNLVSVAETIAYKLDQNLIHRLNRSIPILKTSLVNIDNMNKSCTLGRYLGDQIGTEFSKYGYKVRELRLRKDSVLMKEGGGEFALTRDVEEVVQNNEGQALIVGTYCPGQRYVDVSVRIVSAMDHSIISSCNFRIRRDKSINALLQENTYQKESTEKNTEKSTEESSEESTSENYCPFASGKVKLDDNSSKDTKIIQKRLQNLDYYQGEIDGIWGPKTQSALEDFKQSYNLPDPRKWNLMTQKKLFSFALQSKDKS